MNAQESDDLWKFGRTTGISHVAKLYRKSSLMADG